ncbi:unnamed protein product (macronuclear) [Paramecium tetraurelia]|uniref:Uncharacterized protein n=1 Tax=Paramecium tetraurelia TaxID=5888 RepID=A0BDF3_PARTE|nr:uncharacterized protein GSPATT00027598001 [Paramecium tetraurelia]CAK56570.1 unnamed protein product [Paramecium tetraurelia]|eukprot:XP_001423968.1 hypothetical protein (macronuclear) [Paramecium tetraurelia strain d4-2]
MHQYKEESYYPQNSFYNENDERILYDQEFEQNNNDLSQQNENFEFNSFNEQFQGQTNIERSIKRLEFDSDQGQDQENSPQSQKSTDNIGNKTNIKKNRSKKPQEEFKQGPIVGRSEKKEQTKQSETKNLPKLYAKIILNQLESLSLKNPKQNPQIKKKISKFAKKSPSLKTLREMLQDPLINKISIEYLTSFEFFDQLLGSERLQDVGPPIKYLNKFYQGCLNSDALNQWKES